jgi:hypothetical protein
MCMATELDEIHSQTTEGTSAFRQKTFYLLGAFKCFLAGQKACKTAQGIKYRKYGIKWQAHAHFSHFQTLSLVLLKLT